jgi:hypothetical protein
VTVAPAVPLSTTALEPFATLAAVMVRSAMGWSPEANGVRVGVRCGESVSGLSRLAIARSRAGSWPRNSSSTRSFTAERTGLELGGPDAGHLTAKPATKTMVTARALPRGLGQVLP